MSPVVRRRRRGCHVAGAALPADRETVAVAHVDVGDVSGALRLGPSVVAGYYAQEQETLDPASTPMDVVRALKPMSEQTAIGFLNRYLFTRDDMLGRHLFQRRCIETREHHRGWARVVGAAAGVACVDQQQAADGEISVEICKRRVRELAR